MLVTNNVVGTASSSAWSQAQTFEYDPNHKIMIVVKMELEDSDSMLDLADVGVATISEIEAKGSAVESLAELRQIVDMVGSHIAPGLTIELMVAVLRGDNLNIYGRGEVSAYLARNGQLASLGIDVTGVLKSKDKVLLCTNHFVEVIGETKLVQVLRSEDNPAETLTPLVHMENETSKVAAVLGVVREDVEEVKNGEWQNIFSNRLVVKTPSERTKNINLWIASVTLVLLVLMIGIGMVRRVKLGAEREYNSLEASVSAMISETLSTSQNNPERARALLGEAKGEVQAYLATKIDDKYKQKARVLLGNIESTDTQAFKKNEVKLSTIVELPVLVENLSASRMKSDGKDNLFFNDPLNSRIVSMNLVDRSRQVSETGTDASYTDIGVAESGIYGLNKSGVELMPVKKASVKQMIEADEFWMDPAYISIFAGNVYVLDKGQNEIWKYPTLGDSFGGRRRWFAAGITPDLSNVVDMKVVGDVWILTSSGKLERYSRGAPAAFIMEGFPGSADGKKLSEPSAIWVNDSSVYVLENGASRVVAFGTDGKYQAQYANPEFAKGSDIVVVDNKMYVLIDNVVKEFEL